MGIRKERELARGAALRSGAGGPHWPRRGPPKRSLRVGCTNCRLTGDLSRNQLLGVVKEVAKVDVCAVSETWLNEYDNEAMKSEAKEAGYSWIGVGRKGRRRS